MARQKKDGMHIEMSFTYSRTVCLYLIYEVIYNQKDPAKAVTQLMTRENKSEMEARL